MPVEINSVVSFKKDKQVFHGTIKKMSPKKEYAYVKLLGSPISLPFIRIKVTALDFV